MANLLEVAATAAIRRGAPEHAADLLELSVSITPTPHLTDRTRRVQQAAAARFQAGDGGGAIRLLEPLAAATAPGQAKARTLAQLARIRYHDESLRLAADLLEEALLQSAGDQLLQASVRRDLGWARASLGDVGAAEGHVRAAMSLLPTDGDPHLTASVYAVSAVVQCLAGHGANLELLNKAQRLQPTPGGLIAFDATSCRAQILKWTDEFGESRRLYRRLREELTGRGDEGALPFLHFQESELHCWAGRWQESLRVARAGIELAKLTDQRTHEGLCWYVSGLALGHLGEVDEARAAFAHSHELGESAASIQLWVHTGLGFLELSLGNTAVALEHLLPFADVGAMTGIYEPGVMRFIPDLVEALLAAGDIETASQLSEKLESSGRSLDRPYALAEGARCVGQVAAASNCLDDAMVAFDRSLAAHQRLEQPFERARAELSRGVVLRRMRRRGSAKASLEWARIEFERLGARLWLERAADELATVRGSTDERGMTHAERRIVELVCAGRKNQEVAAALSLSVKTVEVVLTRIYRRLGVRSRTELALRWSRDARGFPDSAGAAHE